MMETLQICFVGLGSIGKRHLKNVYDYLSGQKISFEITLFRSGKGAPLDEKLAEMVSHVYYDTPSQVGRRFDICFVTNPTSLHKETLIAFRDYSDAFFVEKPIFDTDEDDPEFVNLFSDKLVYVACPLRYNPVLQYVRSQIDYSRAFSVRAISSSYLPDWRPGTDYRECYSAHESMGGGVHLDLIHEWDYLSWLFGDVCEGYSIIDKVSELEIDSKDAAIYIARTKQALIELHLDYFGRKPVRQLILYTPEETYECDVQNGRIKELCSGNEINIPFERNDFQMKEIEHFFDIFCRREINDNTVEHAMKVLKYARGVF